MQDLTHAAPTTQQPPIVGVLAVQGAFREHRQALERLGARVREVRLPRDLEGLAGLVIPGGESTTIAKLMSAYGLNGAVTDFYEAGGAVWGTCAGAIMVARDIEGHPEQPRLGLMDIGVSRNAYGRQVASFEADVDIEGLGAPFRSVFIRAPKLTRLGPEVRALAVLNGDPVMAREGRLLVSVFHPELSGDDRVHRYFLEQIVLEQTVGSRQGEPTKESAVSDG